MYEFAASFMENNLDKLCAEVVSTIKKANIEFYSELDTKQMAANLKSSYEAVIAYLRTSDIQAIKDFYTQIVIKRSRQGLGMDIMVQLNNISINDLKRLLTEAFAHQSEIEGAPAAKRLDSLRNRLHGIHLVAITTITAVSMRQSDINRK